MTHRNRLGSSVLAVSALFLTGCFGLPQDVVQLAESTRGRMEAEQKRIDNLEKQSRDFQGTKDFRIFEKYAEREKWENNFKEARAKLKSANKIYKDEVEPLLAKDSIDDANQLNRALQKIPPLLAGAGDSAQQWIGRRDFLANVAKQPDQVMRRCDSSISGFKQSYPAIQAEVTQAKKDHPARAADIDKLFQPLAGLFTSSEKAAARAAAEHKKLKSGGEGDLAVLGDSCEAVRNSRDQFRKAAPELSAKLAELDKSYSRTLMDMKAEYTLVIRRQSWDNGQDYPALHNLDYTVKNIDGPTYDHFDSIRGSLAKFSRGWFGDNFDLLGGVDRARWDSLGIEATREWPSGDDEAEFWLQKAPASYFHKYFIVQNGKTRETGWTEVSEAFFFANIDNLGMDVESKPYGAFEGEKLTQAAPPGMAYVGNPRYGRWQSDGSGGMFWTWVAPYLFYRTMFGSPYRYGRDEWSTWHGGYRGSRAYYGGTSAAPAWGTRSQNMQTSPRMRGTSFARGGGFQRAASSVRGAGPRGRGGSRGASGK